MRDGQQVLDKRHEVARRWADRGHLTYAACERIAAATSRELAVRPPDAGSRRRAETISPETQAFAEPS